MRAPFEIDHPAEHVELNGVHVVNCPRVPFRLRLLGQLVAKAHIRGDPNYTGADGDTFNALRAPRAG